MFDVGCSMFSGFSGSHAFGSEEGCSSTEPQIVWGREGAQRSERPTHGKER